MRARKTSHNIILYNFWVAILAATGFSRAEEVLPPKENKQTSNTEPESDEEVLLLINRIDVDENPPTEEPFFLENWIDVESLYTTAGVNEDFYYLPFEIKPASLSFLSSSPYEVYQPFSSVPKDAVSYSPPALPSYFRQPFTPEDFNDDPIEEDTYEAGRADQFPKAPIPDSVPDMQPDDTYEAGRADQFPKAPIPDSVPVPDSVSDSGRQPDDTVAATESGNAMLDMPDICENEDGTATIAEGKEQAFLGECSQITDFYLEDGSLLTVAEGSFVEFLQDAFAGQGTIQFGFDLKNRHINAIDFAKIGAGLMFQEIPDGTDEPADIDLRGDSQPSPAVSPEFGFVGFSEANLDV